MSPNVVERTAITWTSFEDRFSIAPRTVPVSGRPATPPEETITFNVAGYRVTPPAPEFRKRGRPLNPNAGRRSKISIEHCPDGRPHDWRSSGGKQIECLHCRRTAMKCNMPGVTINEPRSHIPPVLLADPQRFGPCKASTEHRLVRNGKLHNRHGLEGRCTLCGRTGERLPDVGL